MITLLVIVALLLTLLRVGLYTLEQNRTLLEKPISQVIGSPLSIGMLQAQMLGLQPQVSLQQITVFDSVSQQAVLNVGDLRLGVDLLASILNADFRFAWIQLNRIRLTVQRDQQGLISIVGLPKKQGGSVDWLLNGGPFTLKESEILWLDLQNKQSPQTFSQLNATLSNQNNHHQLKASLSLPSVTPSKLQLLADIRGDSLAHLQGHFYLQSTKVDFSRLLMGRHLQGYRLDSMQSDLQLWGEYSHTGISTLSGEVKAAGINVHPVDLETRLLPIVLTRLESRFQWIRQVQGWQLDTEGLSFQINGHNWPKSALGLKIRSTENHTVNQLQAIISSIDLQTVSRLLLSGQWLNQPKARMLKALNLNGKVDHLQISYDRQSKPEQQLSVCGGIQQLAFKSWMQVPGVSNLSGHLCSNSVQGTVDLAIHAGRLDWPQLFRKPIHLTALQGQLSWEIRAGQWQLGSESLQLDTPDFESHHQFHLLLPSASKTDNQPFLDWQGTLSQGRVSAVRRYLPTSKLKPKLLNWLDQAFISGEIMKGQGIFKGPLRQFPFKHNEGLFKVDFRVEDGVLNYGSTWPNVTGIEAQVGFHNSGLQVDVTDGSVLGADIQSAQINIPVLSKKAELTLKGAVLGTFEQGEIFVQESPLLKMFNPVLNIITPTGNARLDLQLKIPLAEPNTTEISGTTYLHESRVHIAALDLTLDKLKGTFRFDQNGLTSQTITAMALGEPIQINLEHDKTTQRIRAIGATHSQKLARYYQPLNQLLRGTLPYQLEVRIPWRSAKGVAEVELNSSLQGLAIHLPPPLGKTSNNARHFHATLAFPDTETLPLSIQYERALTAELDLYHSPSGLQLHGGALGLGDGLMVKHNGQQGLSLSANFKRLDLKRWQSWFSSSISGRQVGGSTPILKSVALNAQQASWGDQHWESVSLKAQRKTTTWFGTLDAKEIKGRLKYEINTRHHRAKLNLELEYLKLHPVQESITGQSSRQQALDAKQVNPLGWPDLDIKSKQLFWKSSDLGSMELKTHRQSQVLMIDHFNIFDDNYHQIAGSGRWAVQGKAAKTQLQAKLDIMDMGNLLARLGWPDYIEATQGEADFSLNWAGALNQPLLDTLTGQFSLSLSKGRLISLGPGLGRMLGILNVDTLKRRLMLDFSDLFARGFAYDGVNGQFKIEAGIAKTHDFTVDGLAATLNMKGHLLLPSRTLGLAVEVTPKTSVTLPLAGVLVGGPVVGAAVLVAQQLLGEQVDSMSSMRYSVTGDWANPVTTRLKGQGGVLDKVWSGLTDFSSQ